MRQLPAAIQILSRFGSASGAAAACAVAFDVAGSVVYESLVGKRPQLAIARNDVAGRKGHLEVALACVRGRHQKLGVERVPRGDELCGRVAADNSRRGGCAAALLNDCHGFDGFVVFFALGVRGVGVRDCRCVVVGTEVDPRRRERGAGMDSLCRGEPHRGLRCRSCHDSPHGVVVRVVVKRLHHRVEGE